MAALDYVLDLIGLGSEFGGRFERSLKLYIKALVLKGVCKVKASLPHTSMLGFQSLPYITGR